MPSKEQVDAQHPKEVSANDEALSNTSSTQGSPTGLIHKLYDAVLSRDVVKKGMKTIQDKYNGVIVEGRHQIHGIKRKGEEVYISTRERVKTWCYSITIYNHFTGLWLIKNLPYGAQKIASFEDFLASFQTLSKDDTQTSEAYAKNYYKQAYELWEALKEPQLSDIKQCCLNIAARAIAVDFNVETEGFQAALVELFNSLDGKVPEIITNEAFYVKMRRRFEGKVAGEVEFRKATDAFYTFAKRFAFLEFPLTYANQDILRVLLRFAQEKLDILGEIFLNRIDGVLNVVIKRLGYEYESKDEPLTLLDKYNVVLEKIVTISSNSYNKSKLAIQGSTVYQFADKRIHFEDRYNEIAKFSSLIYTTAAAKLTPAANAIKLTYDKVTKEYIFTLYDVSRELVKENYANLKKRYTFLKEATLRLRDNILEIKLSKETFEKLSADAKEQVALVYAEVRGLNYSKLKVYGSQAYNRAVDAVKSRVKAIRCCGQQAVQSDKQNEVEEEKHQAKEDGSVEKQPVKVEESPKRVEEPSPKKEEPQAKKVEEQPPKKEEKQPEKVEESPKKVEEPSPKKEEVQPEREEEEPKDEQEEEQYSHIESSQNKEPESQEGEEEQGSDAEQENQ